MCSELSLTWDEHRSTLVGVFERLLESSTLVDCTIAAEGQYLKAHKIILSACSPYFEMLFSQENEKNPIVVLKDIKFQELKALIDFIYRGKVKVPEERLGNFVDAAESLQIKGLGGGNQRRINPELTEKEYSLVEHNEEDHVSPRPRKRCRRSYANSDADKVTGISPVIDLNVNVETKTDEELQSRETRLEVPNSSEVDACPVLASLSESVTTFPSSECNEEENLEIKESSYVEEPTLSESEQLPNVDTVVVKSEPEAIAEVFLPEIDCFIEPKSEDLQETSLGSITGETEAVMGDSQPLSNQYSAFPPVLPSSSAPATVTTATAVAGRSDNLLLMGDVGGSFATQGQKLDTPMAAVINWDQMPTRCDATRAQRTSAAVTLISTAIPLPVAAAPQRQTSLYGDLTKDGSLRFTHSSSILGKELIHPLQHHLRQKRDRLFKCQVCGKAFFRRSYLANHMRTHSNERPFECHTCGKAFRRLCTLQSHILIHTGEKPYKCGQCSYTSTQSGTLNQHVRRMHGSTVDN